jgi:hypothetical protein
LIPTDIIRNPKTILDLIPLYVQGRENEIEPIIVIPHGKLESTRFLICSGNHRAAVAAICKRPIKSRIITQESDLKEITQGPISEIKGIQELHYRCVEVASSHPYLKGGWNEYLRDLFIQNINPNF